MRTALGAVVLAAVTAVTLASTSSPALAGGTGGSSSGSGYTVHASATISTGGGSHSISLGVSVPATCWWTTADIGADPSDPEAVEKWWEDEMPQLNGTFTFARASYGTKDMYDKAIAAAKAGNPMTYYAATCRDSTSDACTLNQMTGVYPAGALYSIDPKCPGIPLTYQFFATGNPPAPVVSPRDLALEAWRQLTPPGPQVDRNPKAARLGGATLVGLPTWFWVTNPESVGGANGQDDIRVTAGATWAQLTAKTNGLNISAPTQGVSCSPSQATTAYAQGVPDSRACTLSFDHASVGYSDGYPVTASTSWTASWQGSDGTGGALDAVTSDGPAVDVPVAESQSIVTNAG